MLTEDQTPVIEFLGNPAAHGAADVERIDTHTSIVFLAGDRAYKLKRAVLFDYVDFSTMERRRAFCEAEVRLNRRSAPMLYLGVSAVTRETDGRLALNGAGAPIEWVVEMARFPQEALFDRLAATGKLDLDLMPPLGIAIARLHASAGRRADHGGARGMAWVIDGNDAGFAEHGADCCDPAARARVTDGASAELARHAALLDARRERGAVRECHGDLHLRNIVLINGQPTLFDGVEFNDEISCIDVLYDLAFLLMDLRRRGLPRHASAVWNRYLAETADLDGLPLLPLFLSCRAAVRAKTSATAARLQDDAVRRDDLRALAREYLAMAEALLHPPPACLVAVGGLSGSGKSTLAYDLAPAVGAVPGALVIRSDEIRKQLCGVPPFERLGPEGYAPEVTARVYALLAARARQALEAGVSVIADAVHARAPDRLAIEAVAMAGSVPFVGLWLDASESTLVTRVGSRVRNPSDADADVICRQRTGDTGAIGWERLDASLAPDGVLRQALTAVRRLAPQSAPAPSPDAG